MPGPRVLVLHNRYRIEGGEERSVALQLAALRDAGIEHRALERRSSEVSRPGAAAALLRGGARPGEIGAAAAGLGADIIHAHNLQPLIGAQRQQLLEVPPQRRQPPRLEHVDERQVIVLGDLEALAAGVQPVPADADRQLRELLPQPVRLVAVWARRQRTRSWRFNCQWPHQGP